MGVLIDNRPRRARAGAARRRSAPAPAKVVTTQYLSSIDFAGLLGAPAVQRAWSGCVAAAEHAPHPPGHAGPRNQRRRCSAYCFLSSLASFLVIRSSLSKSVMSHFRACAGDRSPHARSSTPTWRDLSASGLAIAAEPIAIDRGANGRHGAVSVSSLSDCGPVVRSLRGGTRSVSCAPQHITLSGGLRPWRPPTPSFDNMIHHTS
jgi:hypothetical protein